MKYPEQYHYEKANTITIYSTLFMNSLGKLSSKSSVIFWIIFFYINHIAFVILFTMINYDYFFTELEMVGYLESVARQNSLYGFYLGMNFFLEICFIVLFWSSVEKTSLLFEKINRINCLIAILLFITYLFRPTIINY